MHDAARKILSHIVNEPQKIHRRGMISLIGDNTDDGVRNTAHLVTNLRDGSTLHFRAKQSGQRFAEFRGLPGIGQELIPAGHETPVNPRSIHAECGPLLRRDILQEISLRVTDGGIVGLVAKTGFKEDFSKQGNLKSLKSRERTGIHIMLHEALGNDHITDAQAGIHCAGDTCKNDVSHAKAFQQKERGDRRGHLSYARKHEHDFLSGPSAFEKCPHSSFHGAAYGHRSRHQSDLVRHGSENSEFHPRGNASCARSRANCAATSSLSDRAIHKLLVAFFQDLQARLDESTIDAVVITHGTDTLEETAFFLHLVLTSDKPVVMTAAMRPATALSADGPMNLYQALSVAATPAARGRGVLVVVADRIWSARDVAKRHTQAIDALGDTDSGPLGWAHPPRFSSAPDSRLAGRIPLATLQMDGKASLPNVEILFVAAGSSPDLITAACAFARGLVFALPGNGSVPQRLAPALEACRRQGVTVVRASRTGAGPVAPLSDALAGPLLCAGQLSPAKARIALMLALAQGRLELFEEIAA